MFTGIVERPGVVENVVENPAGRVFSIRCGWPEQEMTIGASVAINGCCLTVVESNSKVLMFEAGKETLSRTNLGMLAVGSRVNLERGMLAHGRFDGHIVTGHVDFLGELVERNDDCEWSEFWIAVPATLTRQMASKGSVTVDGVSLTLVNVEDDRFSVALIPHTLKNTTLGPMKVGDRANIETDILAKYIEKQLQHLHPTSK